MVTPLNPADPQATPDDLDLIVESVVEPSADAGFDTAVEDEVRVAGAGE